MIDLNLDAKLRRRGLLTALSLGLALSHSAYATEPGALYLLVKTLEQPRGDLLGASELRLSTTRIEVIHRSDPNDPSTERVLPVDTQSRTLSFALGPVDTEQIAVLQVPPGAVFQVRLITANTVLVLAGSPTSVKLPSGGQTGLKLAPVVGKYFPIHSQQPTFIEIQFNPNQALSFNKGQGFMLKPTIDTLEVNEDQAIAARQSCSLKLKVILSELVGHVLALEAATPCTTSSDCVVVPVNINCLDGCPNVIASSDSNELQSRLASSDAKWCGGHLNCNIQFMCARPIPVCELGRCRAKYEGLMP